MDLTPVPQQSTWRKALLSHMRAHPLTALGFCIALLVVLVLFSRSMAVVFTGEVRTVVLYALLGGVAGLMTTSLGATPALLFRTMPQRVEDSMLGFSAGVMLAATIFSLILPGLEAGATILGGKASGAAVVVMGIVLGVLLMLGLEEFVPHEHDKSGPCGPGYQRYSRIWLFVFAMALHNLPEGMAIGVAFSHGDMSVGLPLTIAIVVQDIPEGLVVAMALRSAGFAPLLSVFVAVVSGALELMGALLGVGLTSGLVLAYPVGLGFAAGAMLFVVSHEVIPETHRNGHQTPATLGLMLGFVLMMMLETMLG